MNEDLFAEDQSRSSMVVVRWEPVASMADSATVCEVTHDWPGNEADFDEEEARLERMLQELGRSYRLASRQMYTESVHGPSHHMGSTPVHDEVYRQLEQDIVRDLLGDAMGRLP